MPLNQLWMARQPKASGVDLIDCTANNKCLHEDDPIVPGRVVVRARIGRHRVSWHPECWYKVYIPILEAMPYNATGPGRLPLDITEDQRRERKLCQNRHASFTQRIVKYQRRAQELLDSSLPITVMSTRIDILMKRQDLIWWEIQDHGGAPDGWRIPEKGEQFLQEKAEYKASQENGS